MSVDSGSAASAVASRTGRYLSIRLHLMLLVGTILLPVLGLVAVLSGTMWSPRVRPLRLSGLMLPTTS
jgi:hypothetical protein